MALQELQCTMQHRHSLDLFLYQKHLHLCDLLNLLWAEEQQLDAEKEQRQYIDQALHEDAGVWGR